MTEKNYSYFIFFFQSPKHTIVNQLHMYNGIGYKQDRGQTQEKVRKIKKSDKSPFGFYSSCICLILRNKQKMKSEVGEERDTKPDKETVCHCFYIVKGKEVRKILELLENKFSPQIDK